MSILESLFSGLTGSSESSETVSDFTPPTAICRSDCGIAPGACSLCKPYKEKLIDALYNIEHIEEYQGKYEVVGTAASTGSVKCPYCGANSADPYICEYCGSKLDEGTSKIKVASASDIPDPVIEARDIIYDRHAAIVEKYADDDDESTSGILAGIASLLFGGSDSDDSAASSLGNRMSRDEIEQMASDYGVSISTYLKGLDNGTYLTTVQKKAQSQQTSTTSSSSPLAGIAAGLGAAGIGTAAASLLGNKTSSSSSIFSSKDYGSRNDRPQGPPPDAPRNEDGRSGRNGMGGAPRQGMKGDGAPHQGFNSQKSGKQGLNSQKSGMANPRRDGGPGGQGRGGSGMGGSRGGMRGPGGGGGRGR